MLYVVEVCEVVKKVWFGGYGSVWVDGCKEEWIIFNFLVIVEVVIFNCFVD